MQDDVHSESQIIKITDYLHKVIAGLGKDTMGLRTGVATLDNQIKGLKPTELTILAGRPSMGKSAFMVDTVMSVSKTNTVLIFSMEMSATLLIERMLANMSKISYARIKSSMMVASEKQRLKAAEEELMRRNIYIDEGSLITPLNIFHRIEEVQQKEKIDCVFVDYLQLMNLHKLAENRNQEISVMCRHLKAMAKGFDIPFMVLCQLNRGVEFRENNRPRLSDLRDSGSIEQDADVVILIHRPEYYSLMRSGGGVATGQAELLVVKNRNGPVGTVPCQWDGKIMSFSDSVEGDF